MFTWVPVQNWAAILESSVKPVRKELKRSAPKSLNMKHMRACCQKTGVIAIPGLPDLRETLWKGKRSTKGREFAWLALSAFSFPYHLNLNEKTLLRYLIQQTWLGSPALNFENVPNFLYSALHLLKFNLFNAERDLERSVIKSGLINSYLLGRSFFPMYDVILQT